MASDSWDDFLNRIRDAKKKVTCEEPWYRGHVDSVNYGLIPSLLRFNNGLDKEKILYARYEQAALALGKERRSAWETLFDMQHYHIPTRLLDWTSVLGVAIYFAAIVDVGHDPCVYVLNPEALNKDATGHAQIKRWDDKDFDYQRIYWRREGPILPRGPVAIEPRFQSRRLLAQKGKFTVHNDDPTPLDKQCPGSVEKVILPRAARDRAQEFLDFANLNQFSLFPDMAGLAPFIKTGLAM